MTLATRILDTKKEIKDTVESENPNKKDDSDKSDLLLEESSMNTETSQSIKSSSRSA
jgi:hypothetical protein